MAHESNNNDDILTVFTYMIVLSLVFFIGLRMFGPEKKLFHLKPPLCSNYTLGEYKIINRSIVELKSICECEGIDCSASVYEYTSNCKCEDIDDIQG